MDSVAPDSFWFWLLPLLVVVVVVVVRALAASFYSVTDLLHLRPVHNSPRYESWPGTTTRPPRGITRHINGAHKWRRARRWRQQPPQDMTRIMKAGHNDGEYNDTRRRRERTPLNSEFLFLAVTDLIRQANL